MGKKKFIDRKKAATFHLVFRGYDEDENPDAPTRVFTRVDAGENFVRGFSDDDPRSFQQSSEYGDRGHDRSGEGTGEKYEFNNDEEDYSRFADADEESGEEEEIVSRAGKRITSAEIRKGLSEEKRRELIELGFPDDGYDYLQHLRKIGASGVGGAFVPANRFDPSALRADIKAYDDKKVQVQRTNEEGKESERRTIELVSSSSRVVRKPLSSEGVLDADILAALENSEGSEFDSADELEDEFVILANDGMEESASSANVASASGRSQESARPAKQGRTQGSDGEFDEDEDDSLDEASLSREDRPTRFLDEQFEMLALREYDDDELGELDEDDPTARGHADISEFSSVLSEFLTDKSYSKDRYETLAQEGKIEILTIPSAAERAIGSSFDKDATSSMVIHSGVDYEVIKKTLEYTSDDEKEVVLEEASEEEKDQWDCETIVSTLSNLDNHPGKIGAPVPRWKPRIKLQEIEKTETAVIRLGGKQKLPLDYLPKRALAPVKEENVASSKPAISVAAAKTSGRRAGETFEEKKARKAAIKEARREARAGKKALKKIYKEDAQRAQHGAAVTGPAAIHLP
ncbi:hypothetical protein R1sor_016569 [Riccia sorocarpa]|uniref:Low temperature viability protein n=1 Tax=Riccia sorocarpa TaxID=122646 RepID=A0ABD3HJH0_9MARC